jgi:transposase InsO family protein
MPVATTDFVVATTSAALDTFFSVLGFCDALISDWGLPFTSSQFATYAIGRGVRLILSPAYHPRSNGLGERAVQSFKSFLKKVNLENPNMTSKVLNKKILNFLLSYRNIPSTKTNQTPAEMFLNCKVKTHFSNLVPKTINIDTPSKSLVEPRKTLSVGEKYT